MEILSCPVYFLLEFLVWCPFICRTRPVGVKKVRNVDDRTSPRETHVDVCMNNISEVYRFSVELRKEKKQTEAFEKTRTNRRSKKCVRKLNKTEESVCVRNEREDRETGAIGYHKASANILGGEGERTMLGDKAITMLELFATAIGAIVRTC